MVPHKIKNWDDAYANMPNVPNGAAYPDLWTELSTAFRAELQSAGKFEQGIPYGPRERNRFDLLLPENEPVGIHVFIHGGYWMRFDNSYFSHLAKGSLDHGWAVAMPSYPLCPDVTVPSITSDIALAIETIAARISGPIVVSGHSAGGHLATRMICKDTGLAAATLARIRRVMSISGVHDLRPLLNLELNNTLQLDLATASDESPALHHPASA
ncbi:MAG: alpha/beta hydrolase, partial [Nitratireductor sp.]